MREGILAPTWRMLGTQLAVFQPHYDLQISYSSRRRHVNGEKEICNRRNVYGLWFICSGVSVK